MAESVILTEEGRKKLEEELEDLKINKRREIADAIREAKAQGDLSENYEYTAAKEEQADLEGRIADIERILLHAEVADGTEEVDDKLIKIGTKVTVKEEGSEEAEVYTIVGSTEADPLAGKISNESPIGKELIGKKKGQTVEIFMPTAKIVYKIVKVQN